MSERSIPREKFEAIVRECMALLAEYGFTPQSIPDQTDPRFSNIFEDICFGFFFDDVVPKSETSNAPKRETVLTQQQLDEMTLKCALIFLRHGVEDLQYDESLNHIRAAIVDVLEAMGYENLNHFCIASRPGWGCYPLWMEVARQDGLPEKSISKERVWCKENRPEHFQSE